MREMKLVKTKTLKQGDQTKVKSVRRNTSVHHTLHDQNYTKIKRSSRFSHK